MERSTRLLPQVALLFVIGFAGLSRFASGVRAVNVVGLSGSGAAIGVGVVMLVFSLTGRMRS
jgi:hypothetical protein